jgi:AraC family transcriptional regulator
MVTENIPSPVTRKIEEAGKQKPINVSFSIFPSLEVSPTVTQDHILEVNVGAELNFSWFKTHIHDSFVCRPGNVISISSPGLRERMQWRGELSILKFAMPPSYVDNLIEIHQVTFAKAWNVEDHFLREAAYRLLDNASGNGVIPHTIYTDTLCAAIVVHLACQYPLNHKKIFAPKGKLSGSQVKNVIEFIRESVRRNIRLAELAACTNLSEYHFARVFRQTLGLSPYKFVMQMKIEHAKDLMKNERRSFSDIAYLLNFSDQAHFSHAFKKVTGSSPKSYLAATR